MPTPAAKQLDTFSTTAREIERKVEQFCKDPSLPRLIKEAEQALQAMGEVNIKSNPVAISLQNCVKGLKSHTEKLPDQLGDLTVNLNTVEDSAKTISDVANISLLKVLRAPNKSIFTRASDIIHHRDRKNKMTVVAEDNYKDKVAGFGQLCQEINKSLGSCAELLTQTKELLQKALQQELDVGAKVEEGDEEDIDAFLEKKAEERMEEEEESELEDDFLNEKYQNIEAVPPLSDINAVDLGLPAPAQELGQEKSQLQDVAVEQEQSSTMSRRM